ncbi:MAG: cytochrome c-type biogenesis protein CcmH [Dehalococcoidales bacterium]|nr:cytochrome c-type biogenesis protein CcmH [Dehalococcoidales bacterium]
MNNFKIKLVMALILVLLFLIPTVVSAATVTDLAKQFVCQCGCNSVLPSCNHIECGSRAEMNALLQQMVDQGQTEPEITRFFVTRYGEQVLASPPKRGFNLMAWITPFAAIIAGGGVIFIALKKWVGQGKLPQATPVTSNEQNDKYYNQLEQELAEFTERSFR